MKASIRLMRLGVYLIVFKSNDGLIHVRYEGGYVLDNGAEILVSGCGLNFEEACESYLNKISGKRLRIYAPYTNDRREVTVL